MTPQFIMKCSINRGLKEHFKPVEYERGKWDTPEQHRRSAESEIECLNWSNGYAEPGYVDPAKGVLFANWNYFARDISDVLERYGYEIEWSDEWSTCNDCNKAVRTSADSYCWQPSYVTLDECEIICISCLLDNDSAMRDYLESLENNPRRALNLSQVDPAKYGYKEIQDGFESGLHPGQNDNPTKITKGLRDRGITSPILFKIDGVGQFDVGFSVWVREDAG